MKRKPLIGVTVTHRPKEGEVLFQAVSEAYIQALLNAGALAVMLPFGLSDADLEQILDTLDGVLLTGGGDIDPARYHGDSHLRLEGVDPVRDDLELRLVHRLAQSSVPFLGICRGFQVINVAFGGTLYVDIAGQFQSTLLHDWHNQGFLRSHLAHTVHLEPGTRLQDILGQEVVQVNSLHHQGIRDLAPGLRPTGYAPDGLIEGIELPEHPFGLAVQWHPEWLTEHEVMRRLFAAFVEAAREHQA